MLRQHVATSADLARLSAASRRFEECVQPVHLEQGSWTVRWVIPPMAGRSRRMITLRRQPWKVFANSRAFRLLHIAPRRGLPDKRLPGTAPCLRVGRQPYASGDGLHDLLVECISHRRAVSYSPRRPSSATASTASTASNSFRILGKAQNRAALSRGVSDPPRVFRTVTRLSLGPSGKEDGLLRCRGNVDSGCR